MTADAQPSVPGDLLGPAVPDDARLTKPPLLFAVPDDHAALGHGHSGSAAYTGRCRRYLGRYLGWLRASDLVVVGTALVAAHLPLNGWTASASGSGAGRSGFDYAAVTLALVVGWMLMLHLHSAYDGRLAGHGVQEYRQVLVASVWLFSALAIVAFGFDLDFARSYVLLAFPLGTLLLLGSRWRWRRWLVTQRTRGELSDRVLLIGDREHVSGLVEALGRTPAAGYRVVAACVNDPDDGDVAGVPVVGRERDVLMQALKLNVDVVAVSSSAGLGATGLRHLGWALEGTDIELVVAPGIMDVAGPRVMTRPVQGLPLIHVEAPRFAGPQRVFKSTLDRLGALIGLVLLLPVLVTVAVLVVSEDRGPVLFRQERVGRDGRPFAMFKFRSMATDAEARLPELLPANDGAGPLFKLRQDPRVTRVGAWIRRYSVDELPQLLNVLRGEMSLVGPRPPLPREVAEYETDARRRLLVKPGMTGLWQISGRSDLSWAESVRLDLYYVENWTPMLDLMIIWRTRRAVMGSGARGAY